MSLFLPIAVVHRVHIGNSKCYPRVLLLTNDTKDSYEQMGTSCLEDVLQRSVINSSIPTTVNGWGDYGVNMAAVLTTAKAGC